MSGAELTGLVRTVGHSPRWSDELCNGDQDNNAIQNAMLYCRQRGGGTVVLLITTRYFDIYDGLTFYDNVSLVAYAQGTVRLRCHENRNIHMLNINGVQNVRISGIEIDGNRENNLSQTGHNLRIGGASKNIYIDKVYTHDAGLHGLISAYDNSTFNENIHVTDCQSDDNGTDENGSGFYFNGCKTLYARDLRSKGNTLDGTQWKTSEDLHFSGIISHDNDRYGVFGVDSFANLSNVTSYGNQIGIYAESGTGGIFRSTAVQVAGFDSYENTVDGIRVTDCNGSKFENGSSYNNGQDSGQTGSGLHFVTTAADRAVKYVQVTNCNFFDDQGSPTQDFGIWGSGSGTIDLNRISHCSVYGNASTPVRQDTWAATNVVFDVDGFNPQRVKNHGELSGAKTFDRADGHFHQFTLTDAMTLSFLSGKQRGDTIQFMITQGGAGGYAITPAGTNNKVDFSDIATTVGHVTMISAVWTGSHWRRTSIQTFTS